jgi:L-fucose isomerase-like protein
METKALAESLRKPVFRSLSTHGAPKLSLPEEGVTSALLREILPPLPAPARSRLLVVGCGVRIHFPWDKTCASYENALDVIRESMTGLPIEIVRAADPFEDPRLLLSFLQDELAGGIDGIVLVHASYTAGEIGSQLGRWLLDHPVPIMSWSFPERPSERLEANSLCCQNFLLGMFKRLGVRYSWLHAELNSSDAQSSVMRFGRTIRAKSRLRKARVLHVGGSRVTGFYDGETDELAVMKTFGVQFDRVDLQVVFDVGRKIPRKDLERLRDCIVNSEHCSGRDVPDDQIIQSLRLGVATLQLAHQHGYVGCTIKSWPELFDQYGCAADGAVSMLGDYGFCTAEEGEMNGLVSSLALQFVSEGQAVPTLMDLSGIKSAEDRIVLWHCGASPTRWLKHGTRYQARRHSILENADPKTAVGLMMEFLLESGPVTVFRYQSPDARRSFCFEGNIVDAAPVFRGNYGELKPVGSSAEQIIGTIMQQGLDHHWSLGYGHWSADLKMLNHWLGVGEIGITHADGVSGLSS